MQEINLNEIDQVAGAGFWKVVRTVSLIYDVGSWVIENIDTSVYAEDRGAGAWG